MNNHYVTSIRLQWLCIMATSSAFTVRFERQHLSLVKHGHLLEPVVNTGAHVNSVFFLTYYMQKMLSSVNQAHTITLYFDGAY